MNIALIDFDGTLISVDSLKTIMKKEKLFFDIALCFWGMLIILSQLFEKKTQLRARSGFKKRLLVLIKKLSDEKLTRNIEYLKSKVNLGVIEHIKSCGYDALCVVSAGERHIIGSVLEGNLENYEIITNDWDKLDGFTTCFGEEKVRRVKSKFANGNFTVYTDSVDDKPLSDIANKTYIVNSKGEVTNA